MISSVNPGNLRHRLDIRPGAGLDRTILGRWLLGRQMGWTSVSYLAAALA